nr:AraC family transcriptional regulator [uncultured Acetobacteroides sp.]
MKKYISSTPVHRLSYYDLTLITEGTEKITLNQHQMCIVPGCIACSVPGDVWGWQADSSLEGYALVFEKEFLLSFFNDRHFLEKFHYLNREHRSPFLRLEGELLGQVEKLFVQIRAEVKSYVENEDHVLRALVYLVLGLLERASIADEESSLSSSEYIMNRHVAAFAELVEANFKTNREVNFYANQLCITSNYLNKITHQILGVNAKTYILKKVIQEAKNSLAYTTLSIEEISEEFGFNNSSYFIRLFYKYAGVTPKHYRINYTS